MMQDSRALLLKLREQAEARATKKVNGVPYVNPESTVSTVSEAGVSLRNACKKLKIAPLTHHDLRDAFTTSCIEAGVDIPTVASWLGHVDGGALLMRTYTHHRRKHSTAQAAKVSFNDPKA
jgi:integrase